MVGRSEGSGRGREPEAVHHATRWRDRVDALAGDGPRDAEVVAAAVEAVPLAGGGAVVEAKAHDVAGVAARGVDRRVDGRAPLNEERDRGSAEPDRDGHGELEVGCGGRDARREEAGESEHAIGVTGTRDVDALDAPAVTDEPHPQAVDHHGFERCVDAHRLARVPRAVADAGRLVAHRPFGGDDRRAAAPDRQENRRARELLREERVDHDVGSRVDGILGVDVEAIEDADSVRVAELSFDDRIHRARDPVDARRAAGDHEVEARELHVPEAVRHAAGRDLRLAVTDRAGGDDALEVARDEGVTVVDATHAAQADARDADVAARVGGEPHEQRRDVLRALHGGARHARGVHQIGGEHRPTERVFVPRDDHVVRDLLRGEVDAVAQVPHRRDGEESPAPAVRHDAEARAGEGAVEAVEHIGREREPDLRPSVDVDRTHGREVHVDGARVRAGAQVDRSHQHAAGPLVDQLHVPEEHVAARLGELTHRADGLDAEPQVADLEVALGAKCGPLEPHVLRARVDGTGGRAIVADRQEGRRGGHIVGDTAIGRDPRVALGARAVADRQADALATDARVGRRHRRPIGAAHRVGARPEGDVAGALHRLVLRGARPGRVHHATPGVEDAFVARGAVAALCAEVAFAGADARRRSDRLARRVQIRTLRGDEPVAGRGSGFNRATQAKRHQGETEKTVLHLCTSNSSFRTNTHSHIPAVYPLSLNHG